MNGSGKAYGLLKVVKESGKEIKIEHPFGIGKDIVYVEDRKMVIKPSIFSSTTFKYSLDDWTGKYSIPVEFLLSLQIATMSPDLAYRVASEFSTEVLIKLHENSETKKIVRVVINGNEINENEVPEIYNQKTPDFEAVEVGTSWNPTLELIRKVCNEETCIGFTDKEGNTHKCNEENIENLEGWPKNYSWPCDNCIKRCNIVRDAFNTTNRDEKLTQYVPYISCVKDHWFRNVYFEESAIKDANDSITKVDEEYEKQTGERWTEYEMWTDGNGNQKYELYVFKKNGSEYETEYTNLVCRECTNGSYKLLDDGTTYQKSNKGNYEVYEKSDSGVSEYTGDIQEFRVGKKAIVEEDIVELWGEMDKAYEITDNKETAWEEITPDEEAGEEDKVKKLNDIGGRLEYRFESGGQVIQKEEGVRGSTNAKIKEIFLDDYYLFDGSVSTAALINKAKHTYGTYDDDSDSKVGWDEDSDNPDNWESGIVTVYVDKDGNVSDSGGDNFVKYTASKNDISGSISILKNSLSAFTILKNLHTESAEYIYHDFKELIVELDYFDKEELVEAENEVMMFPVKGISSAGWPEGEYDKSEQFYGTLIHSSEDLGVLRQETENKLKLICEGDNPEGLTDEQKKEREEYEENNPVSASNQSNIEINESKFVQSTFLDTATACWKYICKNGRKLSYGGVGTLYPFADSPSSLPKSSTIDCSGYVSWVLFEFSEEWRNDYKGQVTTANMMNIDFEKYGWEVIDVAANEDVTSKLQPGDILLRYNGTVHHVNICKEVTDSGNVITYDCGNASHWQKSGAENGHDGSWFAKSPAPGKIIRIGDTLSNASEFTQFEGFDGGETVVAPVSGEVLKYGTVTRENIEIKNAIQKIESGEDTENQDKLDEYKANLKQEVGYIKIRALDEKDIVSIKSLPSSEDEYKSNKDEYSTCGYKYFYEEYFDTGINDYVMYIEGFDVSGIIGTSSGDNSQDATGNVQALQSYILGSDADNSYKTQYQVPNLLDDEKEDELKFEEQLKQDAVYTYTDGEKIYIKEGAQIGVTYASDAMDAKGSVNISVEKTVTKLQTESANSENSSTETSSDNGIDQGDTTSTIGNYIRLIFRDTDDEVVENVEDYIETDNGKNKGELFSELSEEFMYWQANTWEGFPVEWLGYEEYRRKNPTDTYGWDFQIMNDEGSCPNLMPGLAMAYAGGTALKALGYTDADLVEGNWIPAEDTIAAYYAVLKSELESVQSYVNTENEEKNVIESLVDVAHAGTGFSTTQNLYRKIGKGETATLDDFLVTVTTNAYNNSHNIKRRKGDFYLYEKGTYTDGESEHLEFSSDTPFTDMVYGNNSGKWVSGLD